MRLIHSTLILFVLVASGCDKMNQLTSGNLTSPMVQNLEQMSTNFSPESLDYPTGEAGASAAERLTGKVGRTAASSDPCAGYNIFSCQPVLLRLYITGAQQFLDMTRQIIANTGQGIGKLEDGATGVKEVDGNEVHYKKVSDNEWKILIKKGEESLGYVDVKDNAYRIQMNFSKMANVDANAPGAFDVSVQYTDENTWSMSALVTGMQCKPEDVRAPRRMWVKMDKGEDLWKGKAIIYNPVWAEFSTEPSCSTTETDDRSMALYTDFVGDNDAAKANVYMMKRNVEDLSNINTYALNQFCTTYSGICTGWQPDLSQYSNPFCNPADTDQAVWNDHCTGKSDSVAGATYGSNSDWYTPFNFYQTEIELPTDLT